MAVKCHCCDGTGEESNNVRDGLALSGQRLRAGISLREMARRMGLSHSYLSMLERGLRSWTEELKCSYLKNLKP